MKTQNAIIQFNNYIVDEITFKNNKHFEETADGKISINPEFSRVVNRISKTELEITLIVAIKKTSKKVPFSLKVSMTGSFNINSDIDDWHKENLDDISILENNATAILFPYFRALISSVTLNANLPPLILPTINFAKMLEDEEKQD